ncbi:MAG: LysR family transcriptional regulator [Lachnospiraceae bacterium]|jgi:DNA-binding transcriptional LysR family regulator|nr:LysR family transcriptional regulator [Lachnospiraceae bacterium]
MNLKQIEAFKKVAEVKNFSKAAEELFLTQPTISAHISSLEKEMGKPLFLRTTKEVELTTLGEEFYKYAKDILDLQHEMVEKFCVDNDPDDHKITITASSIPSVYLLPEAITRYIAQYPEENLRVLEGDSKKAIDDILLKIADLAVVGTKPESKECEYIPFYCDELVVIMAITEENKSLYEQIIQATDNGDLIADASKIKDEKQRILLEDLLKLKLSNSEYIMREDGSGTRNEALFRMKEIGIDTDNISIIASMENQELIKSAVRHDVGISVISKLACREEVSDKKVFAFAIPGAHKYRYMYMAYRKTIKVTKPMKRFIGVLEELYKDDMSEE